MKSEGAEEGLLGASWHGAFLCITVPRLPATVQGCWASPGGITMPPAYCAPDSKQEVTGIMMAGPGASHVLCSACNRCRLNERTKPNPSWFWECRSWWVAVSFVITPLSTFMSFSSLVISSAFLFGAQGRVKSVERRWGVIGSEVRVILLAQLQAPGRTHGQFHQSVPPLVRLPLGNST